MAGKFIELKDAATQLGVSADELNDMRLSGEIHAVRDGTSWKFKTDELERVAEDRGISLSGDQGADEVLSMGDFDDGMDGAPTAIGNDDAMSDLLGDGGSDLDLGMDDIDPGAKTGVRVADDDDDFGLDLAGESDLELAVESASDVALVPDDAGGSVNLVTDDSVPAAGGTSAGSDLDFEGSDLSFDSDVALGGDDEIALGDDEDDLTIGDDEEISLDDDDELVLDSGSDITGGSGDTGINLTSPSDSGLNLEEEPLDLAGSSVSSLELPEDDDLIDLEDLDGGLDAPLQADEDFQLAPSSDQLDDDDDSGSQVIALEDSEAFGEVGDAVALEDDDAVLGGVEEGDELETALEEPTTAGVVQPTIITEAAPEMPYSVWNVLSLMAIILLLAVTGMLMTDLIRNMWTWEETYTASSPIMDMMVNMVGFKP